MKLHVLLSAMHLEDYKYINTLNITSDCVVINQSDNNGVQLLSDNGREIKFISTTERGLSRSRNMAISNSDADICVLCDNDIEYVPGYENIILDEFERNPDYDVILFFVKKKPNAKPYLDKARRAGYFLTMKVSSTEIAFRRKSIEGSNISFKTQFGAGSKYSMGEENIFLYDCLKKGLKIFYDPMKIADRRYEKSTWFKGFNKKYFIDRGAVLHDMYNGFSTIFILVFAVRTHKDYKMEISLKNATKFMLEGRKQYKDELEASKKKA